MRLNANDRITVDRTRFNASPTRQLRIEREKGILQRIQEMQEQIYFEELMRPANYNLNGVLDKINEEGIEKENSEEQIIVLREITPSSEEDEEQHTLEINDVTNETTPNEKSNLRKSLKIKVEESNPKSILEKNKPNKEKYEFCFTGI